MLKSFDTTAIIAATSISVMLSLMGNGLLAIPIEVL